MRGVFLPLLLGFAACDLVVGRLDAYFFTSPNCTFDNIGEDDFSAHSGKYNVLSMNCASAEEVPGGGARKSVYVSPRRDKKDYCLTMSSLPWCEGENLGMDVANEGKCYELPTDHAWKSYRFDEGPCVSGEADETCVKDPINTITMGDDYKV